MSVNHRRDGRTSPPEFGVGDADANCPQIVSCFKISSTRLLALQSSKKLTNPMSLTEYSLLPKSISSTSTKSSACRKLNIFLARTRTKNTAQNVPKHAISSINFFLGREPSPSPTPPWWIWVPHSPHPMHPRSPSSLPDPHLRSHNSRQIYATGLSGGRPSNGAMLQRLTSWSYRYARYHIRDWPFIVSVAYVTCFHLSLPVCACKICCLIRYRLAVVTAKYLWVLLLDAVWLKSYAIRK